MKKQLALLSFAFLFASTVGFTQDFAPIGAKWHYNEPNSFNENYILIESVKDSVIHDKNVRVLDFMFNGTEHSSREYIHQSGDSIFYYNYHTDSFYLLYNFAASVGDTVVVHDKRVQPTGGFFFYYDIFHFDYRIVSVDSVQISGIWCKRQTVEGTNKSDMTFSWSTAHIVEGIGSLDYFFGMRTYVAPEMILPILRCYHNADLTYTASDWSMACDFVSLNTAEDKDKIQVFPNPVNDILNITVPLNCEFNYALRDVTGRRIFEGQSTEPNLHFSTAILSEGVYFFSIIGEEINYAKRIVIMH